MRRSFSSERGTVLIQAALGILVLIGFNAFVIDYGIMWVGRGQAQNAADAGALAGAISLAFDDFDDRSDEGPAKTAAREMGVQNGIWGQAPDVDVSTDVVFPIDPAAECAADPTTGLSPCVRVDVYRNVARGNALPMLFGAAIGRAEQGVRATATARVSIANASDCLKPFAIPDKWQDNYDVDAPIEPPPGEWTEEDSFETTTGNGNNQAPLPNPDVYIAATENDPGTGFTLALDYGRELTIKVPRPNQAIQPGWYYPVVLPAPGQPPSGGALYEYNIANCNGAVIEIGDALTVEPGGMVGPTNHGMEDLIALDPDAYWDASTESVRGSCASSNPPCAGRSPRIVAIPLFDLNSLEASGRTTVTVANILGFFISAQNGNEVTGYIVSAPGLRVGAAGIAPEAAFLSFISLVR